MQILFSLGIVSQFLKLCINRKNLLVLDISGFASIQKEFFIFHIIVHSNKNSFCIKQILLVKIASDFEPPPRRKISARKRAKNSEFVWKNGGKSVGRASRVPPSSFEKVIQFYCGALDRNRTCTTPFGGEYCIHSTTRAFHDTGTPKPKNTVPRPILSAIHTICDICRSGWSQVRRGGPTRQCAPPSTLKSYRLSGRLTTGAR